jgi:hypothetical protein
MRNLLMWTCIGALLGAVIAVGTVLTLFWRGDDLRPAVVLFATPTTGAPSPAALASPSATTPTPASPTSVTLDITPEPSPGLQQATQSPTPVERVVVKGTGDDGLNLRSEPSSAAALVKTLPDGDELEVIGEDRQVDGRTWRNVRDPSDGVSGWAAAEFLGRVGQ